MKNFILVIGSALGIITSHALFAAQPQTPSSGPATITQTPPPYFAGKVWSISVFDNSAGGQYGQWLVNITEDGASQATAFVIPGYLNAAAITTMFGLLTAAYESQRRICISYLARVDEPPLVTGVYYPLDYNEPEACGNLALLPG
ncbi:MAG: hypothetical protein ACLPV8_14205 [Steroidobacteraceae bacterium]